MLIQKLMNQRIDREESECYSDNRKIWSFRPSETWQVLEEVDFLMRHEPSWIPFNWLSMRRGSGGNSPNNQHRNKFRNGRSKKPF